jgi:hypothetical protein
MFKLSNGKQHLAGLAATVTALAAKAASAAPEGLTTNMQKLGNAAKYTTDTVDEKSIFGLVGSLVGIFLQVLGVIFVILFIVAGYHWMMAGGDTAKIDKAKDSMWRAIIGLLIIIGAYAIQAYVFTRI